jgi:hypothetical protein
MKNSKINNNRPPLTDKEIKADENFDKLLKQHSGNKLKNNLAVGGIVVAGIILITSLVLYFNKAIPNAEVTNNPHEVRTKGAINPNLFDIPKMYHLINAETGGEVVFNNSIINVPTNAFVDETGNAITGDVEISYREFHNPIDFFLSGIPMIYDSADYQYHFESAGMFEIYGSQNGIPVNLAKPISVSLASLHQGDYFNIYQLDTLSGKWGFISKDSTKVGAVSEQEVERDLAKLEKSVIEITKNKPQQKSKNGACIKIDFKKDEFPELASFKEVLFEIDKTDKNFSPELAKKEWDDVKLKKVEEEYILTFYDKFKPTKLKAKPVLSDKQYEEALGEYNKQYANRLSGFRAKKDSLEKLLAFNSTTFPSFGNSTAGYVERLFEINEFGVWNSDCPMRMPKGRMLAAMYINKIEGTDKIDTLDFKTIYLVEENKNTLYRITNNGTLSYNPSKRYVLWAIDKKEQLCVFPAVKFKAIPNQMDSTYAIEMDISKVKPTNVDDVRKELNLNTLFKDV